MLNRTGRLLTAVAGTIAVSMATGAACAPSAPLAPIAVLAEGSTLQIRYTDCEAQKINQVRVIPLRLTKDDLLDDTAPAVWQVSFPEPTVVRTVAVGGDAPAGGVLDVPLAGPLDPAAEYVAFIRFTNDAEPSTAFAPGRLEGGHVRFEGAYLTREQFERRSECPDQR
jgi:hypothetical protein